VELFIESLSCNFAEMTASSPFMYTFLATNLLRGINGDIEVILGICVQNMSCVKGPLMFDLQIIKITFVIVICIARSEEIPVLALDVQSNFSENDREL